MNCSARIGGVTGYFRECPGRGDFQRILISPPLNLNAKNSSIILIDYA
jgi:hypothetical protein